MEMLIVAFVAGGMFGVGVLLIILEIQWKKEERRLEKKANWRSYYDFCCWMRRRDKPIDFSVGGDR